MKERTWKIIELTQGIFTLVDAEDFERLNVHKWMAHFDGTNWYAIRSVRRPGDSRPVVKRMHRVVMDAPDGWEVDHIKHHGFYIDNRKKNLRLADRSKNTQNKRKLSKTMSSQYKGVDWKIENKSWRARIRAEGKNQHIGYFEAEQKAAHAYNEAAKKYFGEFALLNEI